MRHLEILLAALVVSTPAQGLVIGPAPSDFALDGSVEEWRGRPPAARTVKQDGSDSVLLWVGQTSQGFVVAGRLNDPRFPFAATTAAHQSGSRLEIWLSLAEDFEFPPMIYGEENGAAAEAAAKASCLAWRKKESDLRDNGKKLFTRMWRVVPSAAEEAYALPAYDSMAGVEQEALGFPRPDGLPERRFRTAADGAVTFEVLIPWNLFPPANRLNIERAQFRADFDWEGFTSPSTGPTNAYAGYEVLPVVEVAPPVVVRIGQCAQPLQAFDTRGEEVPAFYFLNPDGRSAGRVFIFDNYQEPYRPQFPQADYKGLLTLNVPGFAQTLGNDEFLCGPYLSYRKGNGVKQFPIWTGPDPGTFLIGQMGPLLVKAMPDGTRLLRLGPVQSFYSLSHKASAIWTMKIFSLSPSLDAQEALSVGAWMYDISGFAIEISDDWRRVTVFREKGNWESETFCLSGTVYKNCGENLNAPAPRRVLEGNQ
jgi:hypothetical protein